MICKTINTQVTFNGEWSYPLNVTESYPLATKIGISVGADYPRDVGYYSPYNTIYTGNLDVITDEIYNEIYNSPFGYITITLPEANFKITCNRVVSFNDGHIYYISPDSNQVGGSYSHFNIRKDENGIRLGYFAKAISKNYEAKIEKLFFEGYYTFNAEFSYLSVK